MATKSEESLRAFVEEEPPEPTPAPKTGLGALLPTPKVEPSPDASTAKKKEDATPTPKTGDKKPGSPVAAQNGASNASAGLSELQGSLSSLGASLTDRVASWDTPGGLGLLLLALFIFLWMIVPVNGGHTRFGLLYLTLTGQTLLPDDTVPGSSGPSGGGCPPGYIPDGKGGCMKSVVTPFSGVNLGGLQPFQGGGWPDFSGPNGFGGSGLIGV